MNPGLSPILNSLGSHGGRSRTVAATSLVETLRTDGQRVVGLTGEVPSQRTRDLVLRVYRGTLQCDRHHGTTCLTSHYLGISVMGGIGLLPEHLCPACGRPMDLTRTIAASPGRRELRTYGCRECGVWVTEGSPPTERPGASFSARK